MPRKRRPFVAVETDIAKDESFSVLADICGYSRDEAIGRIVRLWAWCADRKLQDAPKDSPGYAVPRGVVERFLGPSGVDGLLGGGVDEFALGREFRDGLIYLRGTDITVASMRTRSGGSVTGGRTRAREVLATSSRGSHGRFVVQPTVDQRPGGEQVEPPPPSTSVDPRSQIPDLRTVETSLPVGLFGNATHDPAPMATPRRPRKEPSTDHGRVVDAFEKRYRTRSGGTGASWGPQQGAMVKRLLARCTADEVIRRIGVLFDSPPAFLAGSVPDLATLVQHFDKLAAPARTANGSSQNRAPENLTSRLRPL